MPFASCACVTIVYARLMIGPSTPGPIAPIAHRYRLFGVIGRGATGTVYRARDRLSGRLVALKTLAIEPSGEATAPSTSEPVVPTTELLGREFLLLAGLR